MHDAAATRHFHTHDSYAFNIVVPENGGQLVRIVALIQFWTSDECSMIADQFIMKITISIGGTVCRDQEVRAAKIRCVHRNEFYLNRPLGELAHAGRRCRRSTGLRLDAL